MAVKIEHRLGIQAPADVIWEVLSNVPGWTDWNPIHPKAEGEVRYGERLRLTLALPGEPHREIEPVILDWTPNEAIHWRLKSMGGLVIVTRFLEIEALTDTGCVFSNGEIYEGLMGPRVVRGLRRSLLRGFTAVSESLKTKSEALWKARQAQATLGS